MITVTIGRNSEELIIEFSGHSNYAPQGEDIVCAGISTLTLMCANAAMLTKGRLDKMCSGYSKIMLPCNNDTCFFIKTLAETLEIMAAKYPEHIRTNVTSAGVTNFEKV